MNFIEPDAVRINEKDPYKKIELAGRTCYKSEDKITKTSAKKFVKALINRKHTAMLEHQCFVFKIDDSSPFTEQYINFLRGNKYLNVTRLSVYMNENGNIVPNTRYLVSGNVRAICEREVSDSIFKALCVEYPDLAYGEQKKSAYEYIDAKIVKLSDFNDLTDEEILKQHEAALSRGVKVTGATVHFVNEIPDGGEIVMQKAVEIEEGDTPEVLQRRVMERAEWKILPAAVEKVSAEIISK